MLFHALAIGGFLGMGRLLDRTNTIAEPWGPPACLAAGTIGFVVGALLDHSLGIFG